MSSLTPAETDLIVEGLEDESGLILGLENDGLAVTLSGASGLDVWGNNIFKGSNSTEVNFLKTLEAVPDENMHRFLTNLLDYAVRRTKRGKISLDENAINNIRQLCDKFKDSKPQPQPHRPAPLPGPDDLQQEEDWENGKVSAFTNKTFHALMNVAEDEYSLPEYQRPFSWTKQQITDLWNDFLEMRKRKAPHFMGFIFLRRISTGKYEILDGQQRLLSMSLIVLAAVNRLNALIKEGNDTHDNERLKRKLLRIIVPYNEETERRVPRIRLSYDAPQFDKMVYGQYGNEVDKEKNELLFNAYMYFSSKFASFGTGKEIGKFIADMSRGTYFTELFVPDMKMAYMLFDTINNRGMSLSSIDIVKNHVLNIGDPNQNQPDSVIAHNWDVMVSALGQVSFRNFTEAVICKYGKINGQRNFLDKIQVLARSVISPGDLVNELHDNTRAYQALLGRDDEFFSRNTDAGRQTLEHVRILRLLGMTSHLGVALTAFNRMTAKDFADFMGKLVAMAVRHAVVYGDINGDLWEFYSKVAIQIHGDGPSMADIKSMLLEECPTDNEFEYRFSLFSVSIDRDTRLAKYYMYHLEKAANQGKLPAPDLTLEHVLPQNYTEYWVDNFGARGLSKYVNRLGNFALLPAEANRKLGQADFPAKRDILQQSDIKINRMIGKYELWTFEALSEHQTRLSKWAPHIWKL